MTDDEWEQEVVVEVDSEDGAVKVVTVLMVMLNHLHEEQEGEDREVEQWAEECVVRRLMKNKVAQGGALWIAQDAAAP